MNQFNQQDFTNYTVVDSRQASATGAVSRRFMSSVFTWMFFALGVSAVFALLFYNNLSLTQYLFNEAGTGLNGLGYAVMFAPLGFVMLMSFGFQRLTVPLMIALFLAYSAINGISFSFIIHRYSPGSIIGCFATSSVMFGVMAVMGYTTDKDLTSFGSLLMMGVVGIVLAMMVNMFLHSDGLGYLISIIGVAVFTGLTAYDVQKLKRIGAGIEYEGISANDTKKQALLGALSLYLDFVNLFLMLLRLFGNRRN